MHCARMHVYAWTHLLQQVLQIMQNLHTYVDASGVTLWIHKSLPLHLIQCGVLDSKIQAALQ